MEKVLRTFLGTFFGCSYHSNCTKIHLDAALFFRSLDLYFSVFFRSQNNVQSYILGDFSSGRIGFIKNSKCHSLPIVYTMLV